MVAFVCTHLPAMSGVSVGAASCSDTGAENVSEMVVFGATFCAPGAGVVDAREKEDEAADPPAPEPEPVLDPPALDPAFAAPGCFGVDEPIVSSSTTATTIAAPSRSTHGRRRNGLPARDSRTFMASARSRRRLTRNQDCGQRMGRMRGRCVRGSGIRSEFPASRRCHPACTGGRPSAPAGPGTPLDPPVA